MAPDADSSPTTPAKAGPATPGKGHESPAGSTDGAPTPPPLQPGASPRRAKPNLKLTVPLAPESPPIRAVSHPQGHHAAAFGSPALRSPKAVSPTARQMKRMEGGWPDGAVTPTSGRPSFSPLGATPVTPSRARASLSPLPRDHLSSISCALASASTPSSGLLSPQPIMIDMPSPSFDPLLEHFVRPLEAGVMVPCVMERAARGKAFRMLVEEGNVLLLVAERHYRDFEIASSDGTRIATLHRAKRGQFVLRRATPSTTADPELCAVVLGDREVPNAPSRPRLNHMRVACGRPALTLEDLMARVDLSSGEDGGGEDGGGPCSAATTAAAAAAAAAAPPTVTATEQQSAAGARMATASRPPEPSPVYTRMLSRPAGELLRALTQPPPPPPSSSSRPGQQQQQPPPQHASPASLLLLESRMPVWDEVHHLLTLDYPPNRANLASVQNFQLLPPLPPPTAEADEATKESLLQQQQQQPSASNGAAVAAAVAAAVPAASLSAAPGAAAGTLPPDAFEEPEDAAFCSPLVHGLMEETEGLETFSLDIRHPLSPLVALAVCLAAQDWE